MANGNFGGGNGSTTAPFLVEDAADFNNVRNRLTGHYRQVADIDFENGTITPPSAAFTGSYEGGGFKIKNIKATWNGATNSAYTYNLGLFGAISPPAVVQNIHVENAHFAFNNPGSYYHTINMGGIVGKVSSGYPANSSPISNCSFKGSLNITGNENGYRYIGGIVATISDSPTNFSIKNCMVEAELSVSAGTSYIGGICRQMNAYNSHFKGTIRSGNSASGITDANAYDCSVTDSTLESFGQAIVVGISNGNTIQRCTVTNSNIISSSNVAGIGGSNITNCSVVNSTILSPSTNIERVAAGISTVAGATINRCLVKNCTIKGPVAVGVNGAYGIKNSPDINDTAVIGGTIESEHASGYAAGIAMNRFSDGSPNIQRCYCSSSITSKGAYLSGILCTYGTGGYVRNSFFLGPYIKGLGAKVLSVGFITDAPLSGNQNNYTLDTSQMILE